MVKFAKLSTKENSRKKYMYNIYVFYGLVKILTNQINSTISNSVINKKREQIKLII